MKLDKVLTYQKGKSPEKDFFSEKQVLYLTPEYLRNNSIPNYISDFPSKVEVVDGDLLLLWDGSNAGEFFAGKKGVLSSTMVKFHFDEVKYNREFLFYQLKSFESYLKSQTNGSGIPHVDRELLLGLEVTKFEKSEQTQIVSILKTTDTAILQTEKLIAKYQLIRTGLMQDLLTNGIDAKGNIRSKATHKFAVKNGFEVPQDWEVEILSKHCQSSAFGPRFSGTLYSIEGNIATLRTTDIDVEGNINYSSVPFAKLNERDFEKHFLKNNDLLITRSGTVGLVSVFKEQPFPVIAGAFLIRFRLLDSLKPEFLRYYFGNETGKKHLLDIAEGGVQKNIRGSAILNLFIPIPGEDEQTEIINRLNQINGNIEQENIYFNKLCSIKKGLMQDLLGGKVRVK